jgi:hypothetical protein
LPVSLLSLLVMLQHDSFSLIFTNDREMRWHEVKFMKFSEMQQSHMRETVRTNQKIYWFLWKVSPSQLISRSDLDIFFLISKTYSSSSSSSTAWTPPLARTYVSAALKSDNGVSG